MPGNDATGTKGPEAVHLGWQVRIGDPDGQVLGVGALLDEWHVLTCAHVVGRKEAAAVGAPARWVPLTGLRVDFHRLSDGEPVDAEVDGAGWAPLLPDGRGDVAVLRLGRPVADVAPARLSRTWREGDEVRLFGFPEGLPSKGLWTGARVVGPGGMGNELLQIDTSPKSSRISRGFSGAALVREADDTVLGVLVAADTVPDSRACWALPVRTIVKHIPAVDRFVAGGSVDRSFTRHASLAMDGPLVVAASRALVEWLDPSRPGGVCVLVGEDAVALLARLAALTDKDLLAEVPRGAVSLAAAGTVPRPGSIDVAVAAQGKRWGDLERQIADVLDLPSGGRGLAATLARRGSLAVVVNSADRAADAAAVFTRLLEPLAARAAASSVKLLIGVHEPPSGPLAAALALDMRTPPDPPAVHGAALDSPSTGPVRLPVRRAAESALDDVGALVARVAEAEDEAQRLYHRARKLIFAAPPAPIWAATALSVRAAALRALVEPPGASAWTTAELAACAREASEATARAERSLERPRALIEYRNELRRVLGLAHSTALARRSENEELSRLYDRARDLLWRAPCDLDAARRAVRAYEQGIGGGGPDAGPSQE